MRYVGIDLSTKTGFVAINQESKILLAEEIQGDSNKDPKRMVSLTEKILQRLDAKDKIIIEGFSYGSRGRGMSFQFGLGHYVRNELYKFDFDYEIVTPGQLKKFATGKGNASKDNMILPIYKKWGFEHESDNVRDAFVLAKIGQALNENTDLLKYEKEVIKEMEK